MAIKAIPAPAIPIVPAMRKPVRLPHLPMIRDAGILVNITAINWIASGRVAKALLVAKSSPIKADTVISNDEHINMYA